MRSSQKHQVENDTSFFHYPKPSRVTRYFMNQFHVSPQTRKHSQSLVMPRNRRWKVRENMRFISFIKNYFEPKIPNEITHNFRFMDDKIFSDWMFGHICNQKRYYVLFFQLLPLYNAHKSKIADETSYNSKIEDRKILSNWVYFLYPETVFYNFEFFSFSMKCT